MKLWSIWDTFGNLILLSLAIKTLQNLKLYFKIDNKIDE